MNSVYGLYSPHTYLDQIDQSGLLSELTLVCESASKDQSCYLIGGPSTSHYYRLNKDYSLPDNHIRQTIDTAGLKLFTKQQSFKDYSHLDHRTRQTTDNPGLKLFTKQQSFYGLLSPRQSH